MNELALRPAIALMSPAAIDYVRQIEAINLARPQTALRFEHDLHAGMYARTMIVPELAADEVCVITAALIKIPTLMISHGDAMAYTGEDEPLQFTGHMITRAAAGRCQAFIAKSGFRLTMIFPTQAKTVEEAEAEFTDEAVRLMSRKEA